MHDMSNTHKDIAARLGFAAKEVFAADKRTTAGALRKALKAKGITSAADLEWHGISAKDPDSTPYWLYEDGSMEKIKSSRPGAKAKFAENISAIATEANALDKEIGRLYDRIRVLIEKSDRVISMVNDKQADPARARAALTALKAEANALVSRSSFSRPGAKTRMTREQTEEQKAGLKIMSAADPAVGAKIAQLIKEGKPQDQAVAIALDMKRRGEL